MFVMHYFPEHLRNFEYFSFHHADERGFICIISKRKFSLSELSKASQPYQTLITI